MARTPHISFAHHLPLRTCAFEIGLWPALTHFSFTVSPCSFSPFDRGPWSALPHLFCTSSCPAQSVLFTEAFGRHRSLCSPRQFPGPQCSSIEAYGLALLRVFSSAVDGFFAPPLWSIVLFECSYFGSMVQHILIHFHTALTRPFLFHMSISQSFRSFLVLLVWIDGPALCIFSRIALASFISSSEQPVSNSYGPRPCF
ncbi:uncharacterized protein EI97DRAFT_8304 [Westerdykella ornata]|uniref:Uncharacterized protein n=1 Tax=Westerdykella ornata TaxID=318751 RepID=A0A6A6JVZ4_WESOR|nr:uncharacterized protein EI97DRAFT_8304 [Westerdykella ornata]KAF2280781.1 hypothetical protein EI97DRAFT_8304 [Westerdykella ornata]